METFGVNIGSTDGVDYFYRRANTTWECVCALVATINLMFERVVVVMISSFFVDCLHLLSSGKCYVHNDHH